jgi:hypothetical protein
MHQRKIVTNQVKGSRYRKNRSLERIHRAMRDRAFLVVASPKRETETLLTVLGLKFE